MKQFIIRYKKDNITKTRTFEAPSKADLKARLTKTHPDLVFEVFGPVPSVKALERYTNDGICPALDGCRVKPDGTCVHGYESWLLALGLI